MRPSAGWRAPTNRTTLSIDSLAEADHQAGRAAPTGARPERAHRTHGRLRNLPAQRRNLRRERTRRLPLQGRERDGADLQGASDGRRQIGGFYLPGDIFGMETGEEHTFSAEAVGDTKALVIK